MSFKKYIDIERLGHEDNKDILINDQDIICVEEKVDGGNGSFWQEEDGIHFGTRNRDLTSDKDKKTFQAFQIQLSEHLKKLEDEGIKIYPDYIYYFEWMAVHTIRYTKAPFIIGFDIRLKHSINGGVGLFLPREAKEKEFARLKIECVPLIWSGLVKDLRKLEIEKLIPQSKYIDTLAEGIVIKNYNRLAPGKDYQLFAKVVRTEFKEANRAVFGSVKAAVTDTQRIVETYVTEARIRKQILKLINEDNLKLEMALMKYLPANVIKDVLKEEFITIYGNYKFLDFKEFRQLVMKPCLNTIQKMMSEQMKVEK